jgi:hypothetical protein
VTINAAEANEMTNNHIGTAPRYMPQGRQPQIRIAEIMQIAMHAKMHASNIFFFLQMARGSIFSLSSPKILLVKNEGGLLTISDGLVEHLIIPKKSKSTFPPSLRREQVSHNCSDKHILRWPESLIDVRNLPISRINPPYILDTIRWIQ